MLDESEESLYDQLPSALLIDFYYYINKNIEKGVLTRVMSNELCLIERAALRRNILLLKNI